MIDSFESFLIHEKRFSQHTCRAYLNDLYQFTEFVKATFEIHDPLTLDHSHLRSWIIHLMERGQQPRSVNRKIATLKSFYKFCVKRGVLESNPASRLKSVKTAKDLPQFVSEVDMMQLLTELDFSSDFSGTRDQLMLELFYATGMRLSELIGLKTTSVNPYDQSLKVLGKRNKERIIPIHRELQELLNIYTPMRKDMAKAGQDHLLLTDAGESLYPVFVYRTVKKYLSQITTLSKKSPHVLRHTFATHLLNKGADLKAVKDLLGHASLASTQIYTHNSIEKLKAVFDQAHPKA